MIYKGKYPTKVINELKNTFKNKVCPKCNKSVLKMVEVKFDTDRKEVIAAVKPDVICCTKIGGTIANTISKIFVQNSQ
jgi:hypothetical protein